MRKINSKIILFVVIFSIFSYFFFANPPLLDTANFTTASVTLSNSRFSYRAGVGPTVAANVSAITILGIGATSSSLGDYDTNHLFPGDSICLMPSTGTPVVCRTTSTVISTLGVGGTYFNMAPPLGVGSSGGTNAGTTDYVLVNQATAMRISLVVGTSIPSNGDLRITIPGNSSNTAQQNMDGFANTNLTVGNTSTGSNGWDLAFLNSSGSSVPITTSDISISSPQSGCNGNWTVAAVTPGTANHTIRIDRDTNACPSSSTINIQIGSTASNAVKLTNPAPVYNATTSRTQGVSQIYTINVISRDGSDNTIDTVDMKVAPVEGVLVSATVDTTLAFTVTSRANPSTSCGQSSDVASNAFSVPWGLINASNSFYDVGQGVTISTNAASGYNLTVEENDQMGKDGVACSGATAGESVNCIQDTTCDSAGCTASAGVSWTGSTINGFGFSLEGLVNVGQTAFSYGGGSNFIARQFPDQEVPEAKQNILSSSTPVSGTAAFVCFRINVSATQPAGYYYNRVKYTATPNF